MKIRSIPDLQSFIALRGRVIVDTYRGQVRIRSWPKKQTEAHKAKNANQIRWFAAAREMAKWAIPSEINASKLAAKGKGFYPGDIQMMAAAGNLIPLIHGDPDNYEKWIPRLDPVSFQGIRALQNANQAVPASTNIYPIWGVPAFQSAQFWTAGDPTHFVIPAGVDKVQLACAGQFTGGGSTFNFMEIQINDITAIFLDGPYGGTSRRWYCATGPLAVVQGDTFRCRVFSNVAGTIHATSVAWFTLEVLETTP